MPLTKIQKQKIIEDLKKKVEKQKIIIFVDFTGLKVKELSLLRKKLKTAEGELKVVKKTLMKIALGEAKLNFDLKKLLGEIALVFGYRDIVLPAKTVWQFSEDYPNLKILSGILENNLIEAEKIIELAKLPAREELLAKLIWCLNSSLSNFVNVLQGNIKGLINVLTLVKT